MRFRLDYPGINCRQCRTNFEEDGVEPDCDGCPVRQWDDEVTSVMALYDTACIWGELDHGSINQAFDDHMVPPPRRRRLRRCLIGMHRLIQHDVIEKRQWETPKPE